MHLSYKVTSWITVKGFDENKLDELQSRLRMGEDPLDVVYDFDDGLDFENNVECEEYISPEENGWAATVEIYSDDGELVWDNSPEANLE